MAIRNDFHTKVVGVTNQSLIYDEIQDFKYVDSVAIAKDFVPGSKTLEHCAAHLGIEMGHHHNALGNNQSISQRMGLLLPIFGV